MKHTPTAKDWLFLIGRLLCGSATMALGLALLWHSFRHHGPDVWIIIVAIALVVSGYLAATKRIAAIAGKES